MQFQTISYQVEDHIATIVLNRPEKLNAFNNLMGQELVQALDLADMDDSVRVVIFTGEGKAYCAGSDLSSEFPPFGIDYDHVTCDAHRDPGGVIALRLFDMKKPLIAAINGTAVGVGATMTLPMDIRIASAKAKFGFVFASRGIVNEACSGWFLPRIVNIGKALEWVATGRMVSATEALETGLIHYVADPEEVYHKAVELAQAICRNTAPVSVALARQLMYKMLGADHPMESHKLESMMIYWCGMTRDAKEGVESFFEKRPPVYNMSPQKEMPPFYPWWKEREFPRSGDVPKDKI